MARLSVELEGVMVARGIDAETRFLLERKKGTKKKGCGGGGEEKREKNGKEKKRKRKEEIYVNSETDDWLRRRTMNELGAGRE